MLRILLSLSLSVGVAFAFAGRTDEPGKADSPSQVRVGVSYQGLQHEFVIKIPESRLNHSGLVLGTGKSYIKILSASLG